MLSNRVERKIWDPANTLGVQDHLFATEVVDTKCDSRMIPSVPNMQRVCRSLSDGYAQFCQRQVALGHETILLYTHLLDVLLEPP